MPTKSKPQESSIACNVLPGMFRGEYLAIFSARDPQDPSKAITVRVFADKENFDEVSGTPSKDRPVKGRLKVYVVAKKQGFASAILPQPGQPVGESVVVSEGELASA